MYIEFDSYFIEYCCVLKAPKSLSHTQINQMFQKAMNDIGRENVINYFVHRLGFKVVENANGIQPIFVIDLDTDRVYCPSN